MLCDFHGGCDKQAERGYTKCTPHRQLMERALSFRSQAPAPKRDVGNVPSQVDQVVSGHARLAPHMRPSDDDAEDRRADAIDAHQPRTRCPDCDGSGKVPGTKTACRSCSDDSPWVWDDSEVAEVEPALKDDLPDAAPSKFQRVVSQALDVVTANHIALPVSTSTPEPFPRVAELAFSHDLGPVLAAVPASPPAPPPAPTGPAPEKAPVIAKKTETKRDYSQSDARIAWLTEQQEPVSAPVAAKAWGTNSEAAATWLRQRMTTQGDISRVSRGLYAASTKAPKPVNEPSFADLEAEVTRTGAVVEAEKTRHKTALEAAQAAHDAARAALKTKVAGELEAARKRVSYLESLAGGGE